MTNWSRWRWETCWIV